MKHYHNNGKKTYQSIPIPEELEGMITQTIASARKEKVMKKEKERKTMHRWNPVHMGITAAAVVFCCFTLGLNTSATFAQEMSKVPVLGTLSQILTIRSYHGQKGDVMVDVDVPEIQIDQALPKAVNQQIQKITDDYIAAALQEFADDKEAYLATGGSEEEWQGREMYLKVDYDVKYQTEDILSLELITAKSWVSSHEEHIFYNLNLKKDQTLTLEDILGAEYAEICNNSIITQIENRISSDDQMAYFGFGNSTMTESRFTTVTPETKFYLNEKGHVVIVFDEYEIAPGSMGVQKFEIIK